MKKIEKIRIESTNTEVELIEPPKDNAISRYNKDLPQEYKKVDFLEMPDYWKYRQIEAYCEFTKEVIPNASQLITKSNTLIGCSLAEIGFPKFSFRGEFSPTHSNTQAHHVSLVIDFKFDFIEVEKDFTDIEIHEGEGEDLSLEKGEKVSDVWNNAQGTLQLAENIFKTFGSLSENDRLIICAGLLHGIQSAIDINSQDTTMEVSGFSNSDISDTKLAEAMASARMKITLHIYSPKKTVKAGLKRQ